MKIEYDLTKYFNDNNLFDETISDGINIEKNNDSIVIRGNSRDLVGLADILVNLAKSKNREHIHLDDSSLISKNSNFKELVIDKI